MGQVLPACDKGPLSRSASSEIDDKESHSVSKEIQDKAVVGQVSLPWKKIPSKDSVSKEFAKEDIEFTPTPEELSAIVAIQRHWRGLNCRFQISKLSRIDHTYAMQEYLGEFRNEYMIARNRPENDEHWNDASEQWVGRASMSIRHRFLIRRDLHWRWFNALIFGMVDNDGKILPRGELAGDTIEEIKRMKSAATRYVDNARKFGEEWSNNIGLFFHVYGHNSVNSLHIHIIDLDFTGPSFQKQAYKNMSLDAVLEGLTMELSGDTGKSASELVAGTNRDRPSYTSQDGQDLHVGIKVFITRACPAINDVSTFLLARNCLWCEGGPPVVQSTLEKYGFLKKGSPNLTSSTQPLNVFARLAKIDNMQVAVVHAFRQTKLINSFRGLISTKTPRKETAIKKGAQSRLVLL